MHHLLSIHTVPPIVLARLFPHPILPLSAARQFCFPLAQSGIPALHSPSHAGLLPDRLDRESDGKDRPFDAPFRSCPAPFLKKERKNKEKPPAEVSRRDVDSNSDEWSDEGGSL